MLTRHSRHTITAAMRRAHTQGFNPYNSAPIQARVFENAWRLTQSQRIKSEHTANILLARQAE